ncbi:MAG: exopolysaccharide biosynthesis protein [Alphaproteobacteria bacterium]|nr:exopolysaccharide biosynthesis protein [Alphaproteobacteria bacterium]
MNQDVVTGLRTRQRNARTSELLRDFASALTTDRVTVGDIVSGLGDRGLGVLIAIFSLPNILPSTVPFSNVATGIPPLIFAIQLMLGVNTLILPNFIARRTIGTKMLKAAAPRVASVLSWFERLLKLRLPWVTTPHVERVIGAISFMLALVCMLPIPFAHNLPALGLLLIGLGLIERDGLAILIGSAIGIFGTLVLSLVLFGLAHGLSFIIGA